MTKCIKIFLYIPALTIVSIVAISPTVWASDVIVNPPLIDLEVAPRDVITKEITIKNETEHRLDVFATVNEIAVSEDGAIKEFISPVMTDQTDTVTSWIEVTRGLLEIEPHGSVTVPITLRVNAYAKPGTYHAYIGFVPAQNRPIAEQVALKGDARGVVFKAVLQEKKNELLRISSFAIDRFVFLDTQRDITVEVENKGDTESVVKGEIIFYNSRGEELASVPVNNEGATVAPNEIHSFTLQVPFADKLGRFKANVKLDYGQIKKSSIFDTTQFFMVPFMLMVAIVIGIIIMSLFITYLLRRALYVELHDEDKGSALPLFVRNDREHDSKDHDIHIKKGE